MPKQSWFDAIHHRYANAEGFLATVAAALDLHELTQAELARRSGVDYRHVHRLLRGSCGASLRTLIYLDEAMSELVGEDWA